MKIKIQKLCFRLSAFLAVFAIVLALVLPAGAVSNGLIDYNDYVYKVEVVGDEDLVYVRIPASFSRVNLYDRDNNYSYEFVGENSNSYKIPFEPNKNYRLEISIFGNRYDNNGLDLSLIPPGTNIVTGFGFTFDGDVSAAEWGGMTVPRPFANYHYYAEGSSTYIDADTSFPDYSTENGYDNLYCVASYTVRNVDNAARLSIEYLWEPIEWISAPVPTGIVVKDATLVFTISSLLRQQQITGKTNKLLEEVSAQLAEQNKTLDDFVNSEITPETPDDGGVLDDYENISDDLIDSVGDIESDYDKISSDLDHNITSISIGLLAVTRLIVLFTDLPFFDTLINISLSLGLTGTVLGIINIVITRSRVENSKNSKSSKSK